TVAAAAMGAASVFLIGKQLQPDIIQGGRLSVPRIGQLTFLERSYLAGKVANEIGADKVRRMSSRTLDRWIAERLVVSDADLVQLDGLKNRTRRWLNGRMTDWQTRQRATIDTASREWDATVARAEGPAILTLPAERRRKVAGLSRSLAAQASLLVPEMDRMLQTDMSQFFQEGQMQGVPEEEIVYKIPRPSACIQCFRLHIGSDGQPIKYVLGDVEGNSNVGAAPDDWMFTIGPVHPHCYCILHRETQEPAPGPSQAM
ncbi:unnamed protein product, partial [marine sediment metagenome]